MFTHAIPSHEVVNEGQYRIESWINNPLTKVIIEDVESGISATGYAKLNPEDEFDSGFGWNLAYLRASVRLGQKTIEKLSRGINVWDR